MEGKKKLNIPWGLLFNIVILGLTVFLILYFVFSEGGFVDLLKSGLDINEMWICIAVGVHLLNIFLDSLVIYLFIKQSYPKFTLRNAIVTGMTGQFFCAVTPSATGGQPMQILVLSRMGVKPSHGTSALIQKFIVWQFTLSIYCIIAVAARFSMFSQYLDPAMWFFSILGFSIQVGMIIVLLLAAYCKGLTTRVVFFFLKIGAKLHFVRKLDETKQKIEDTLTSFHDNNKALSKNKALLVKVYVITAVQMTAFFLVPYCIARSFGINFDMFDMLCAQSYVHMISCMMPLPGGSGAAEYCFTVFFGTYFPPGTIKTAILIWRTITYYGTIAISAPFARMRKKQAIEEERQKAVESEP